MVIRLLAETAASLDSSTLQRSRLDFRRAVVVAASNFNTTNKCPAVALSAALVNATSLCPSSQGPLREEVLTPCRWGRPRDSRPHIPHRMTGSLVRRPWVLRQADLDTRTFAPRGPQGVVVASPDAAAVATLVVDRAFFLESKHTLKCLFPALETPRTPLIVFPRRMVVVVAPSRPRPFVAC